MRMRECKQYSNNQTIFNRSERKETSDWVLFTLSLSSSQTTMLFPRQTSQNSCYGPHRWQSFAVTSEIEIVTPHNFDTALCDSANLFNANLGVGDWNIEVDK